MTEIAIYGLPVRMPHWSFGVRYIYQLIQHRMGLSRLFEVVFPGNPGRAYLAKSNSAAENVLVTAHVLGHADFSTQQHAVPAQPGAGRRAHRRAGRGACAPDRHGDRGARAGARGVGARRRAGARAAHRHRSRPAPPALSGADGTSRARRRTTNSRGASPRSGRTRRARSRPGPRSARRSRRIRSATCCGSSRSTRRSWSRGSATSSSPCAKSRSISIRCSRARS